MRRFQFDPSTVKVDWALERTRALGVCSGSVAPGTVHVADSVEQIAEALRPGVSGAIPADPFLLVGQMTIIRPLRSPSGTELCGPIRTCPSTPPHDAGDGGIKGTWGADDLERFADRMQQRLERLAPGFSSRIKARRILGPHELQARDANLIGGAINGGTSQLHQELVFRPVPGRGRAETPIRGLVLGLGVGTSRRRSARRVRE